MKLDKKARKSIADSETVTEVIKKLIVKKGEEKEGLSLSNLAQKLADRKEKAEEEEK